MAAVRASKRVSIAWSGAPAFEDTDTLVLTIEGWSLDLRVFNSGPAAGTIDWSTVARVVTLPESTPGELEHDVLDAWWTLQVSTHKGRLRPDEAETPQLRWDHLIDSRPPQPSHVPVLPDQGRFISLDNGDVEEHGIMYNPKTMVNEPYIETWRRLPAESRQPYCVIQREGEDEFMGRVGSVALGLSSEEGVFRAWRDEMTDGVWTRVFEHNARGGLPVDLPDWKAGEVVELDGQRWVVHVIGIGL